MTHQTYDEVLNAYSKAAQSPSSIGTIDNCLFGYDHVNNEDDGDEPKFSENI